MFKHVPKIGMTIPVSPNSPRNKNRRGIGIPATAYLTNSIFGSSVVNTRATCPNSPQESNDETYVQNDLALKEAVFPL